MMIVDENVINLNRPTASKSRTGAGAGAGAALFSKAPQASSNAAAAAAAGGGVGGAMAIGGASPDKKQKATKKATTTTTTTAAASAGNGNGKSIEEIYTKKTQLEHILLRPDTYIGSIEKQTANLWVFDQPTQKIVNR